ncbi:MAG: hypothetical protein QXE10_01165 [Desulfurococcaceae archaeon]
MLYKVLWPLTKVGPFGSLPSFLPVKILVILRLSIARPPGLHVLYTLARAIGTSLMPKAGSASNVITLSKTVFTAWLKPSSCIILS